MGVKTAGSSNAMFGGANAAVEGRQSQAEDYASRRTPETYRFDPYEVNKNAALLSRVKVLSDRQALRELYPEVYAGQQEAMEGIAGGEAGDDAYLRSQALKAGLAAAAGTGARIDGPNSVGGATVGNIFGRQLLEYRNNRRGQQLALAQGLQPSAAIDAGDAVSAIENSKIGAIETRNGTKGFLTGLQMNSVQNANNRLQQVTNAEQARLNSAADASNARSSMLIQSGVELAKSGMNAVGGAM
jgi:hypothetical protein